MITIIFYYKYNIRSKVHIVKQKYAQVSIFLKLNILVCIMNTIQDRLKLVRRSLNLTQTDFGNKINRSLRAIQNYESGGRNINGDLLLDLQDIFNVNIDWMRTGQGEMFIKKEENNVNYGKYQWLNSLLDKLPEEDVKQIELEAQKILEKQYNKEMIINPSKNIG